MSSQKQAQHPRRKSAKGSPSTECSTPTQICDNMPWAFFTYVSQNGNREVQKAIDDATVSARISFNTRLRFLANTAKADWHEPGAKKLKGVEDIYEIRFQADKKQYRPLGFFGPGVGQFTILVWAIHKQRIYEPSDAINTAAKRRVKVISREASYRHLEVDGENFSSAKL